MVHWRREWQTTSVFLPWEPHEQYEKAKKQDYFQLAKYKGVGFPGGSGVKNPPANAEDVGLIPNPGRLHVPWGN